MGTSHKQVRKRNIKILGEKFKGKKVKEIAKKYSLTRSRVYQILNTGGQFAT